MERRAFEKLRGHPRLKEIWRQYLSGNLDEQAQPPLTHAEIDALWAGVHTPAEQSVVRKVLRLIGG